MNAPNTINIIETMTKIEISVISLGKCGLL